MAETKKPESSSRWALLGMLAMVPAGLLVAWPIWRLWTLYAVAVFHWPAMGYVQTFAMSVLLNMLRPSPPREKEEELRLVVNMVARVAACYIAYWVVLMVAFIAAHTK